MDSEKWQRVKALFESAMEKAPAERAAFLTQACAGDDSVRAEVESLLASHEGADSFAGILKQYSDAAAQCARAPEDAMPGRRIGPYQVIRLLGQGGMAVVYLAVRADDQYKKFVAIKLVPSGLDSEDVLRRFRNERQTLAALDHPNIVKLLDGGTTQEGLPYLVMDYIEGTPIDEYCDHHKLSTGERLRLFLTVCAAVSYAHQRLVIHRDLKPGNILVSADGTPKLLDFGIAKLLNPEALSALVMTRTGQRAMTPEYASPEQARGEPLTNATDIYSLGVLLYELLTGHRPYHLKNYTAQEIERAICEHEPTKPSRVITQVEKETHSDGTVTSITPETVSRARGEHPQKLRSRLSGDLDAVVMMALRKEPQRRYASVYEFSEDTRRHLQSLPVLARPSTVMYRTGKFLRRHQEAAVAVVIAFALLASLIIWQTLRRTAQPERAPHELTGMHFMTRPAVAVLGFRNLSGRSDVAWLSTALSEMLNTELAAGEQLRTIPGEDVARMKIELSLPDTDSLAADTLARVHNSLGASLVVLGSFVEVGKGPDTQLRLNLRLQDAASGETLASVSQTGTERQLFEIVDRVSIELRGTLEAGELSSGQAADVRASLPSSLQAARLYSEGVSRLRLFDALGARDLLEKAVSVDPENALMHSALAEAWSSLGYEPKSRDQAKKAVELSSNLSRENRLLIEGRYHEISREWDKAVEVFQTLFTFFPDNLDYGLLLAKAQTDAGKPNDALATIMALRQSARPAADDPRLELAAAYSAQFAGNFKQELAEATDAITKGKAMHAGLLIARAHLLEGWAERNLGEHQKARAAFHEAAQIYQTTGDRGGMARALHNIAVTYLDETNVTRAMEMYRRSLAISRELGNKRMVSDSLNNVGLLLLLQGDLAEAQRAFEELVSINREIAYPAGGALAQHNLAVVLSDEGNIKRATELENESLAAFRTLGQKSGALMVENYMALLLITQGKLDLARKQIEEVIAVRKQLGEKGTVAISQLILGRLYMEDGQWQQLQSLAQQAADEFRTENHPEFEGYALAYLARALLEQGQLAESRKVCDELAILTQKIADPRPRFFAKIQTAFVIARSGQYDQAIRTLQETIADTKKSGFLGWHFDARLALAQLEIGSGNTTAGLAHLRALETDATRHGFLLIARDAAAARRVRG